MTRFLRYEGISFASRDKGKKLKWSGYDLDESPVWRKWCKGWLSREITDWSRGLTGSGCSSSKPSASVLWLSSIPDWVFGPQSLGPHGNHLPAHESQGNAAFLWSDYCIWMNWYLLSILLASKTSLASGSSESIWTLRSLFILCHVLFNASSVCALSPLLGRWWFSDMYCKIWVKEWSVFEYQQGHVEGRIPR
jgi:hypothetical protein